ncbi:MAG: glycosyl transferase [Desulfosporosinus sp. BRH_c37]|nr:MAG: glycosyl transferase [Desulfosporosinus sp. BRH_c37]
MKHRVLIASPVKQKERILSEFLYSLIRLEASQVELDFAFIDDHNDHTLLSQFALERSNVRIFSGDHEEDYHRDESTHYWQEDLVWKVARYKDRFIKIALDEGYDYLFLVDSDLYLDPNSLPHLLSLKKDIVSEVYWTRWKPELIPLPQVWIRDQYTLYESSRGEPLSEAEIDKRTREFLQMLSHPGTYKVGGLGACTLITRNALKRGVSFQEIYNLGLTGEDRHFCVRAVALGLELYADTHYPPFHIYRESELEKLQEYKENLAYAKPQVPAVPSRHSWLQEHFALHDQRKTLDAKTKAHPLQTVSPGKITFAMLVRNESGRHLEMVLKQATEYIDHAVILDDASEDNTALLCQEILQGIPLNLHSNKEPLFHNEILLRKQLWEMALSTQPEWIIILDADEMFEEDAPKQLRELLTHSSNIDYFSFRLYDLWTETHYREDSLWQAHKWYRPFIVRNIPGFCGEWQETPQHCGRFPKNIMDLREVTSPLRIKHLGWVRPQDRLAKYYRYKQLDPHGTYGNLEQYRSILDPNPTLVAWIND